MAGTVVCRVSPGLAVIKYRGTVPDAGSVPATGRPAITLGGLYTESSATLGAGDEVGLLLTEEPAGWGCEPIAVAREGGPWAAA